jgi:hypothetical protein
LLNVKFSVYRRIYRQPVYEKRQPFRIKPPQIKQGHVAVSAVPSNVEIKRLLQQCRKVRRIPALYFIFFDDCYLLTCLLCSGNGYAFFFGKKQFIIFILFLRKKSGQGEKENK